MHTADYTAAAGDYTLWQATIRCRCTQLYAVAYNCRQGNKCINARLEWVSFPPLAPQRRAVSFGNGGIFSRDSFVSVVAASLFLSFVSLFFLLLPLLLLLLLFFTVLFFYFL